MKKKATKMMTILFIGLLALAASQIFLVMADQKTVYFWNQVPVILTYFLAIFYLFIKNIENERIQKIYTFITGLSYLVSFHHFYIENCQDNYLIIFLWVKEFIIVFVLFATYFLSRSIGKNKSEFKTYNVSLFTVFVISIFLFVTLIIDNVTTLFAGSYLYFASLIIFIVLVIISVEKEDIRLLPEASETLADVSESFIYANYHSGSSDDSHIKDNFAAIINVDAKHEFIIIILGDVRSPRILDYSKIKRIELKTEDYVVSEKKKNDSSLSTIVDAILDSLSIKKYANEFMMKANLYERTEAKKVTMITVIYSDKREEKTITLYTKVDSSLFFEMLEKTLPFSIERI